MNTIKKIKRSIVKLIMLLGITGIMVGLMGFQPASADVAPTNTANEVSYQLDLDIADASSAGTNFSYKSKEFFKSTTNDKGQIMLAPVNRTKFHWQLRYAKKCKTFRTYPNDKKLKHLKPTTWVIKKHQLKKFKRAAITEKVVKRLKRGRVKVQAFCFFVVKGDIPDTGVDVNGQPRGWSHSINQRLGKMLFELARTKVGGKAQRVPVRRGQAGKGKVFSKGDCANKKPGYVEFEESEVDYGHFSSFFWHDSGEVEASVRVGGSATISQGNCSMTLNYNFNARGAAEYSVLLRGKTRVEAEGSRVNVVNTQSAYGNAKAAASASVQADLEAKFSGCDNEPQIAAPQATGPTVNDVLVNNERTMTFTGKLAQGQSGFGTASAGTGTIRGENRKALNVDANGYFTVTFTYRAGDEPGRDTVTLVVDQSDGQSVTATTMGRDAAGNVVPHFEVRAAPVDPL